MPTKPLIADMLSTLFERQFPEPISVTLEPFDMKLSYYTQHELGGRCFLHYMRLEHTGLHRGVDIIINSMCDRDNFTLRKTLNDMEFFSANNCRNISSDTVLRQHLGSDSYFCYRCYQLRMGRFINSNFGALKNMLNEIGFTLRGYCLLSTINFNESKTITESDYK